MRTSEQQKFLDNIIFSATLAATVQRASVYRKDAPEPRRQKFRNELKQQLEKLREQYSTQVSDSTHCENIETLARDISEKCEDVLADGNFRIGLAQKALNLYLKFYWCLGVINIPPPHCPIDSIVLKEVPEYNDNPWTKITQIDEYMNVIKKVRKKAGKLPLAEWEMQVYNNAQK